MFRYLIQIVARVSDLFVFPPGKEENGAMAAFCLSNRGEVHVHSIIVAIKC